LNCTVIISCGKTKNDSRSPIYLDELYTGYQTRLKIELARKITDLENIYVLSGELGLVPLRSRALAYDSNNRMPGRDLVKRQLESYKWKNNIFYIGQKKYFHFLLTFIPNITNVIESRNCSDFCKNIKDLLGFLEEFD